MNAAKTLDAYSDQRFVLGLGVSHQPLVERLRGHHYAGPVSAMRAYLEAMNDAPMMASESTSTPPRLIAALGPKMLELGAELADGVHPYLVTPEHTAEARRRVGKKFVAVEQAVVVGQSREEFLRRAHDHLNVYTGLENYRNSWRRLGFTDDDFIRGGSDRLCDAMVVHHRDAEISARITEQYDAGADHVCLQVLGAEMAAPPIGDWQELARLLAG
jgi:probable F420-dependent oxidoreductase